MADRNEPMVSVRGAMGFWHSVPASQVEQFKREQKELEESGELRRRLEEQAKRVTEKFYSGTSQQKP